MRLATLADKAEVEAIVNDPMLRTWYSEQDSPPCDATRYLTAPSFVVVGDEGCFLAHCIERGRYVVHTNLKLTCRGANAVRVAKEAMAFAFLETDCVELVSMVPDNLPQALWLAKAMGMTQSFRREKVWKWNNLMWGLSFVACTIDEWILKGVCRPLGKRFHEKLHTQIPKTHEPDSAHDDYVGAAVSMIKEGQVDKAVSVYNRWARWALYEPIKVISRIPLRIDIRDCVLRVEEGDFNVEVVPCLKP